MKRRFAVGALAALLTVGSLSHAADPPSGRTDVAPWRRGAQQADAAPKPDEPTYTEPWYKRWFGIGPDAPKPPPPERRDPAAEAAAQRSAAEAALLRRQEVCDELRQIAAESNNPKLATQADELERRAVELYKRQTAHLPASRMIPSEDRLDRNLGTGTGSTTTAANKLTGSDKPAVGPTGQANAFREVKQ